MLEKIKVGNTHLNRNHVSSCKHVGLVRCRNCRNKNKKQLVNAISDEITCDC